MDVYDDSPTLVTTWLTIMPKISILIFLLQLLIGIDVYLNLFSIGISQTLAHSASFSSAAAAAAEDSFNLSGTTFEPLLNLLFNSLINILNKLQITPSLMFSTGGVTEINLSIPAETSTANLNNLNSIFPSVNILTNLLLLSSLLSLIIGAIVGLSQVRIKRLLAYSTINHVGFILLALSVFSNSSIEAFIFYIIQYTITNLNIFLIILALSYIINNSIDISYYINGLDNEKIKNFNYNNTLLPLDTVENKKIIKINISDIEYINSLKGLFYKNPILSLSFSICLFSFAGVTRGTLAILFIFIKKFFA